MSQSLYQLIGAFVVRHWRAYIASALMLIGIAVLTVWVPRVVGQAVDGLVAGTLQGAALMRELVSLVIMGAVIYLLRVGWRLQLFSAAYQLGVELRTRLYDRLSLQGPPFFNRSRTGDLMARATNDVDSIEMAAGEAFLAGFDGTLTLILVIAMMALGIDWRLALIALLPFPLMAIAFWFISRRVHTAWRDSLDRFSNLNDHVQETIAGVRTLRALGLETHAARDFAQRAAAAADANFCALKWEAAYEPAVGFTLTAATALTLGVGGWLVWQQQLTVGELTSFAMYLSQLIWPMFAAGWVLSLLERGKAGWTRLQPTLLEPLSVVDQGTATQLAPGALRFESVTFSYRSDALPAVADVSFDLQSGQTLGIVGPTGAGKTTLLALLLRHYAPDRGRIVWSGHAIDQYRLDALRAAVSWVPQEAFLFSATLAENIALARSNATRAEIERAAELAALHDDIARFPHGYETMVGERGITLSGGQRQRVAIARSLLTEKPLLLLDDALSAVDTGTETQILAHLRDELQGAPVEGGRAATGGAQDERRAAPSSSAPPAGGGRAATGGTHKVQRTAIIVSHRLSAVADADLIIVLKAGRIVERGSHDQLLNIDGWYAAQWRYQQLEASLESA